MNGLYKPSGANLVQTAYTSIGAEMHGFPTGHIGVGGFGLETFFFDKTGWIVFRARLSASELLSGAINIFRPIIGTVPLRDVYL
jgi:hypothetical protein